MMIGHLVFWRAHRFNDHRDDWRGRCPVELTEHSASELAAFDRVLKHKFLVAPAR